jgi:hypothetical protein
MESKPSTFVKRLAGRWAAVAFATCVTATACSHNDGSIYIVSVLAPPTATAGAACTYQAVNTGPFITSGILDVGLAQHYEPAILVGNQLVARGDNSTLRVETNRFLIQGCVVRLTDAGGNQVASFTVQGGAEVDPSTSGTPGLGIYFPTLVDPATVAQLRKNYQTPGASQASSRLVAYFKVYGATTGGQSMESVEFEFPIDTCYGCLVTRPADSSCSTPISGSTSTTVPCSLGQDQAIDCRLCPTYPVCVN